MEGMNRRETLQRKEEKGEEEGEGREKNRKVGRPNKQVGEYSVTCR